MSKTIDEPLSSKLIERLNENDAYEYISYNFTEIFQDLKTINKNETIKNIFDKLYLEHVVTQFIAECDGYDTENLEILNYYFSKELRSVILSQYDEISNTLSDKSYFQYVKDFSNSLDFIVKVFVDEDYQNSELLILNIRLLKHLKDLNFQSNVIKSLFGGELEMLYNDQNFNEYFDMFIFEVDAEEDDFSEEYYENLLANKLDVVFKIMLYLNPTYQKYRALIDSNNQELMYLLNDNIGLYALHFIYETDIFNKELTDKEIEQLTLKIIDHLENNFSDELYARYIKYFNTKELDLLIARDYERFIDFYKRSDIIIDLDNEVNSVSYLDKEILYACLLYVHQSFTPEEIIKNKDKLIGLFNEHSYELLLNKDEELLEELHKRCIHLV